MASLEEYWDEVASELPPSKPNKAISPKYGDVQTTRRERGTKSDRDMISTSNGMRANHNNKIRHHHHHHHHLQQQQQHVSQYSTSRASKNATSSSFDPSNIINSQEAWSQYKYASRR